MSSKRTRSKKRTEAPTSQIYLGPTIPGSLLIRYTVFRGELHKSIVELADNVPAVKRLIVDTKEMANVENQIGDKTTVYAQAFANVANHIKEVIR